MDLVTPHGLMLVINVKLYSRFILLLLELFGIALSYLILNVSASAKSTSDTIS